MWTYASYVHVFISRIFTSNDDDYNTLYPTTMTRILCIQRWLWYSCIKWMWLVPRAYIVVSKAHGIHLIIDESCHIWLCAWWLCDRWNMRICVEMCTWWCLFFLVILVHLVILIDDGYFGDSNEVWIICMWFSDLFGNNDFIAYTFEMMNHICWVD